jgi:hypothetical protein
MIFVFATCKYDFFLPSGNVYILAFCVITFDPDLFSTSYDHLNLSFV